MEIFFRASFFKMTIIALASTDRKFARELRLQLVGWGYRPWMADPEESIFDQLQDRGADLLILDFTASRRLSLAAEKHGVPLYLVRIDAKRDLSSARMRWEVRGAASPRPRWNGDAPGTPAWRAELFRARAHPPGTWILHDDGTGLAARPEAGAPDHGDLAAAAGDRSLAAR